MAKEKVNRSMNDVWKGNEEKGDGKGNRRKGYTEAMKTRRTGHRERQKNDGLRK